MTKTQTFSNMKNMPQTLKWREVDRGFKGLTARQRRYQNQKCRQTRGLWMIKSLVLICFDQDLGWKGTETKMCWSLWPQTQKCIEKQSYTVILSWAKPVTFPVVLVQNCLCVGLTCQWPQSPYCIWSHISNLDLQPLLASRSGSWTSHLIQRNLCHSLVYITHDGHSSAIIAQPKAEDGIRFRQTGISWLSQWVLQPLKLDRGGWEGISWHSKPLTSHSQTMEWWSDGRWV